MITNRLFRLFVLKGWLYDQSGSYNPGFIFLGAVLAIGTLLFAADGLRQNCNKDER